MWKTFENCKEKIEADYKKVSFACGMPSDELKLKANKILRENEKVSVSKAKSETMTFILDNAGVCVPDCGIFAYKIDHNNILLDYLQEKRHLCDDIRATVSPYESTNTMKPDMDFGHVAPDWNYLITRGFAGVINDLKENREKFSEAEKTAYFDERIAAYSAVCRLMERFAEAADTLNTEKGRFMAENFRQLATNAPKTLAQGFQFILTFYHLQMQLDTVILRSLGGIDRMLYPLYKADLESGRYTKEQLAEIIKYFLFEISCMEVIANLPFYICGMDEKGNDATNELTYLLLSTYRELDIYDPKIHVMYHKNIDRGIVDLVLEMIREGKNSFVFMNTEKATEALQKIGINEEDSKKVIVYGCYETAAEGTEIPCTCAGMINLAKAVELSIHNGRDVMTGKQVSLKTGESFGSFDEFFAAVLSHIENYTVLCMDTIAAYEPNYKNINPSLLMSPTYKASRESGVDVYEGGAKYNNTSIVGAGLATLTDSLVAIKNMVFDEKLVSFDEFKNILLSNWESDLKLRLKAQNRYAKFGNNADEADRIAAAVYNRFADTINGRKNGRGGVFKCGMFSGDWRYWMGETTAATPDGRLSGEPLSKNLAATVGKDKNGVTAYLNTLLKLDSSKCSDGYVADVVLHQSAVKGEDGMAAFRALLLTFMEKGGFSVHFNVLSPSALINAQKEPEKYRNLQIRLCGWNVRFVDLEKHQQDEFIKQSSNAM